MQFRPHVRHQFEEAAPALVLDRDQGILFAHAA
jgi:hypothetical protein